jgi:hypothetical protein
MHGTYEAVVQNVFSTGSDLSSAVPGAGFEPLRANHFAMCKPGFAKSGPGSFKCTLCSRPLQYQPRSSQAVS